MTLDMSDYIPFSAVYNVYPDGRMVITFLENGKDAFGFAEVSKCLETMKGTRRASTRRREQAH